MAGDVTDEGQTRDAGILPEKDSGKTAMATSRIQVDPDLCKVGNKVGLDHPNLDLDSTFPKMPVLTGGI